MMTKGRFRLLFAGIISLLLLSSFSVWKILQGGHRIDESLHMYHKVQVASKETVRELILVVARSQRLTESRTDSPGKAELNQLHEMEYPRLKQQIRGLALQWSTTRRLEMESILEEADSMIGQQRAIVMDESITRESNKDRLQDLEENDLAPHLLSRLNKIEEDLQITTEEAWTKVIAKVNETKMRSLLLSSLMFAAGVIGLIIMLGVKRGQS